MDTKYRRHLISRAALLERCAIKELKEGPQPCTLISREDMVIAIRKYLETDEGSKYRPVKPKEEKISHGVKAKYRDNAMLTFEGAVKGLFVPPTTKDTLYVASYIHAMLVRLKRIRNNPNYKKELIHAQIFHEAKRHVTEYVAEKATRVIMRWLYPKSNEADYFYPTTYDELRRGRKATSLAGGGVKKSLEVIPSGGQYRAPGEVVEVDEDTSDIDDIVNRVD